jgi:hypothetical protein
VVLANMGRAERRERGDGRCIAQDGFSGGTTSVVGFLGGYAEVIPAHGQSNNY